MSEENKLLNSQPLTSGGVSAGADRLPVGKQEGQSGWPAGCTKGLHFWVQIPVINPEAI